MKGIGARTVRDVPGNDATEHVEDASVRRGDVLKLDLPKGGGYVARYTK